MFSGLTIQIARIMKYFLFFGLLLILSCNKKNDQPDYYWGSINAIKNGEAWEGKLYAVINKPFEQGIDIIIERFNEKGYKREYLFMSKIPLEVKKSKLNQTDVRIIDTLVGGDYGTLLDDGDVAGDDYLLLDDSIDDFVEITETKGKEIKGKFQMSFVKDLRFGEADPTAPDTVIFTDGVFHTRIQEL